MEHCLQLLEKSPAIGSLEAYTRWVNQLPMLSKEEELLLAEKFTQKGDLSAARHLVLSHLRFVIYIARGFMNYGLQQADLIQEGNIGLMKAVKKFNPKMGVRLASFAVHWIKAEIHEFVLRNFRIVKIATTKAQRRLFFNLRKMANKIGRLGWFTKEEINLVAKELKVKPKEVIDMEIRLNNGDVAYDLPTTEENDEVGFGSPCNFLALEDQSASADPATYFENEDWDITQEKRLNNAITSLDSRSRDIIEQRWLNGAKATLHELAEKYHVSAERVRQLEQNALRKLKEKIITTLT